MGRTASINRKTNETEISLVLNLDGSGKYQIDTGLPFLDHMLAQIAVHGVFDLEIEAKGDLDVDAHHTVEDTAIVLGQGFSQALGERGGIVRVGSAVCPMEESLGFAAADFCGRPYAVIEIGFNNPMLGNMPTTLFVHFLESFSLRAGCTLHTRVMYGRDDHHKVESVFKAVGRALEMAVRIDPRRLGEFPSSKGVL